MYTPLLPFKIHRIFWKILFHFPLLHILQYGGSNFPQNAQWRGRPGEILLFWCKVSHLQECKTIGDVSATRKCVNSSKICRHYYSFHRAWTYVTWNRIILLTACWRKERIHSVRFLFNNRMRLKVPVPI